MMIFALQWIYGQDPPVEFTFNQSTLQAFYFFNSVTINGAPISSNDWVAAFNGDICVGARQWDESNCGGSLCDVPVMGDDGSEYASGYMQNGDIPTFKVYDASTNSFFDAVPSESVDGWGNNVFSMKELLMAWSFNPADYQYNGSVTAQVNFSSEVEVKESDMVGAFINGEIRGGINGSKSPFGNIVFLLMIFSNETVGEIIEFKFFDPLLELYIDLDESIEFTSDMTIGNAEFPFLLISDYCASDLDGCGICGGDNSSCADCAGAINGNSWESDCGCVGAENSGNDCDDCFGVPNGISNDDECGVCDGSGPAVGYDCDGICIVNSDCFGICGGSASEDICGNCCGPNGDGAVINCVTEEANCTGYGCTNSIACNYNPDAVLDGGCVYPEENYNCDGDCSIFIDCAGECGGSLVDDECGICGGDSSCLDIDVNTIYSFSISNVYPNPFNPVVNIDLSIDIAGHLQLSVFTVDGTQIKTIYNGTSSIGESTFIWTPKNRASGFYFINAILDDRVKTQKVLFLK